MGCVAPGEKKIIQLDIYVVHTITKDMLFLIPVSIQDITHTRFIGQEMLLKLRKLQLVDEYILKLHVMRPKSTNQLDVKSVERCKKKKQCLLQHVCTYIFLTATQYIRHN
jgi:hypothetical protein